MGGLGLVPESPLTHRKSPLLLTELTAQSFLAQIAQLQFVEDATDLDTEHALFVVGLEAVGDKRDLDTVEAKLRQNREHEEVVAGESVDG